MKSAPKIISVLSLAATLIAPLLFAFKMLGEDPMKAILLLSTVAWFSAAPFWMKGGAS